MNTPIESTMIPDNGNGESPGRSSAVAAAARTRRKLVAGGMVAPLLMTVAGRPVWAGGTRCSPSALASANLSGRHTFAGCGISAGWWARTKNWSKWPPPATPGTMFHSVFVAVKFDGKVLYKDKTLGQVISMPGSSVHNPSNLGMHLVAAYLNALQFPTQGGQPGYPYTVNQVVDGYNALDGKPVDAFAIFKATLEAANNLYDPITDKPTL
ncbi:MAG: hypothetical protein ACYCVW_07785 [Rhodocyclaceae bacterium]|jgi:hypothetical protein